MKALVLADIDKRIENCFPTIEFDYMGYAIGNHIPSTHEDIMNVIGSYDFLISEFDSIDKEIMDRAQNLKMIICCRGGVHTVIDIEYAAFKGIEVRNTPGRNAVSVAEYVMGVIINSDRYLSQSNELVLADVLQKQKYVLPQKYKDSLWGMDISSPYHVFRGKGLHNITLGVIGYGNVGKKVVEIALKLGMKVMVYNHNPITTFISEDVQVVDKDYLLSNCDYISLHCNNKMHRIEIGEKEFSMMKAGAFFINTARGDLVDENALISNLNSGHLSGAALDVTQHEPLPSHSPLISATNIFITPHIAGASDEVIQIGTDMAIDHLRDFIKKMEHENG